MRRWSWPSMGSVASLAVPSHPADAMPEGVASTVDGVHSWLDEVEDALSPFRGDSDLCRWRSGRQALCDCSPLLGEVVQAVRDLPERTDGGFNPYDRRGRFDPTGYVKGWAIERAVGLLHDAGIMDACLGVGGDIQMIGCADTDRPWRVAVTDPADPDRILAVIEAPADGSSFSVATSGMAQRGEHIWSGLDLHRGSAISRDAGSALASVTVAGPNLSLADAFATAIWALARDHPVDEAWQWLAGTGYEALAIGAEGWVRRTPGMGQFLVLAA